MESFHFNLNGIQCDRIQLILLDVFVETPINKIFIYKPFKQLATNCECMDLFRVALCTKKGYMSVFRSISDKVGFVRILLRFLMKIYLVNPH